LLHKVSKGFARGSFCEGLALGLSLNVDLKRVIEFSTSTVQNSYVKGRLDKINDCLLEGQTLEEALRRTGIFMSMQLAQIGIAEKTGYIAETICELSKADLEARMQRISIWSQFIGPIAILFLGFIIALVAISILSPMMDLQMSVD
jgi:general secretion pathway protein F